MAGKRVFFQTGSDEHGQKIANTAKALGVEPIDICDKYAGEEEMMRRSFRTWYFTCATVLNPVDVALGSR